MSEARSATLRRVLAADACAGCGLCAGVAPGAIEMDGADGWLRPRVVGPVAPEAEAAIAAACPALDLEIEAAGRPDHVLWGPIVEARIGHATDPELRRHASSGGGLSALLVHLLETGAVDYVLQTAASDADPLGNMTVTSLDRTGVFRAAGSRYAPSAPLADIEEALARDAKFAFVGKPCDVAALRALARVDPRVDARVPAMLSFFCAGVPNRQGAVKVVQKLGFREDEVTAFRFRGDGWPGQAKATGPGGETRGMSYADSWGGILSAHVQFRCKICPDGTGGFADIVCADAWETDAAGYPLFEEAEGESMILARTEAGAALARAAEAAGRIEARPFAVADIAAMQPGQLSRRRAALARSLAMPFAGRPMPRHRGFHLAAAARQGGLKSNLRNFLGTLRRLIWPKR